MIKFSNFKRLVFLLILAIYFFPTISQAALVPCGRTGQPMCTLCDFIVGIKGLIDYGFIIMVVVALAMLIISGVVYVISAGSEGMMTTAKSLLKNVLIGFAIILGAWLIINTTMWILGAKGSTDTGGTLGIGVESWNKFNCNGK
jgi:hypothetical protein